MPTNNIPILDLSTIPIIPPPMIRQNAIIIDDEDYKIQQPRQQRPVLMRRESNVINSHPTITRQNTRIFTIEEIENINRNLQMQREQNIRLMDNSPRGSENILLDYTFFDIEDEKEMEEDDYYFFSSRL